MGLLDPATSDGRVIFFLPWQKMTIAGTTDTPTNITHHPIPSEEDINFILNEVRNYLSHDVEGNVSIPLSLSSFINISQTIPALRVTAMSAVWFILTPAWSNSFFFQKIYEDQIVILWEEVTFVFFSFYFLHPHEFTQSFSGNF